MMAAIQKISKMVNFNQAIEAIKLKAPYGSKLGRGG
jgi:hypothetical protein